MSTTYNCVYENPDGTGYVKTTSDATTCPGVDPETGAYLVDVNSLDTVVNVTTDLPPAPAAGGFSPWWLLAGAVVVVMALGASLRERGADFDF